MRDPTGDGPGSAAYGFGRVIDCRNHAGWVGNTSSRDIVGSAVVGRGTDKGQSQRDIYGAIELQGLERYQTLIVIHCNSPVEIKAAGAVDADESRVRSHRTVNCDSLRLR